MNSNEVLTERYYSYDEVRKVRKAKGVFVGWYDKEAKMVRTGFSRCHLTGGDKFDMAIGVAFAVQQAIFQNVDVNDNPINQDFWDHYINFINRCQRYFKYNVLSLDKNGDKVKKANILIDKDIKNLSDVIKKYLTQM